MPSMTGLRIDLKAAAQEGKPLTFLLREEFFKELEQEEINGGNLEVMIKVKEVISGCFKLNIMVKGDVTVQCDRCLDDVEMSVEVEDEFKVVEDTDGEDAEIRTLAPGRGYFYDVAWDIYEMVEVALPIQRVHDEGQCNQDMAERLENLSVSE